MARASAKYTITASDKASATVNKFVGTLRDVDKVVVGVTGGLSVMSGVGVGTFAAIYKQQAPLIDRLAKTSDMLDVTTQSLQAIYDAGERAGLSNTQVEMSLQRMTRRLSEANQGTGEAVKALDELGLSAADLARLSPDQQFDAIAQSLEGVENQSDKVRLAFKFFDSEGVRMLNLTAGAVAEARKEISDLGLEMTRLDAAKVESANDEFQRTQRNVNLIKQRIVSEAAPSLEGLSQLLINSGTEGVNMGASITDAMGVVNEAIGLVGDTVQDVGRGFSTISSGLTVGKFQIIDKLHEFGVVSRETWEEAREDATDAFYAWEQVMSAEDFSDKFKNKLDELNQKAQGLAENGGKVNFQFGDIDPNQADKDKPKSGIGASAQAAKDDLDLLLDIYEQEEQANALRFARQQAGLELTVAANDAAIKSAKERANATLSFMMQETAGVTRGSRMMFEINKAAALAHGALNLKESIMSAYAAGSEIGGPPLGAAWAAIAGAAQLANLAAIQSTSFGSSSGSAPSLAASPGTPVTETGSSTVNHEPASAGTTQNFYFIGDLIDEEKAENLIARKLPDAYKNDKISLKNGIPRTVIRAA